jgi:tetratricopeptide (TPR) repeat protein
LFEEFLMTSVQLELDPASEVLSPYRDELRAAKTSGDERRICLALTDLGQARFRMHDFSEGVGSFDEAVRRAEPLNDLSLIAHCLGTQILAYQEIDRHHDAYGIAEKIYQLSIEHGDRTLECSALLNQGQILLDSGEPMIAAEKFTAALDMAVDLGNHSLEMKAIGGLGNHALEMTAIDEAKARFVEALEMARALGDVDAEHGYLGNLALIHLWQGAFQEAVDAFLPVLSHIRERGDVETALQTLHQLVRAYRELGNDEQVVTWGAQAVELAQMMGREALLFELLESMILANYRLGQNTEAERLTNEAILLARQSGDQDKETNLMLSLGESYMLSGMYEQAISAYASALNGAVELERERDEAYLTGRMGVALAELGRVDEAMIYHRSAVDLARQREIPDLEGEQLSMLAFAYLEKQDLDRARTNCVAAIEALENAGLNDGAANARSLLAEVEERGKIVVA